MASLSSDITRTSSVRASGPLRMVRRASYLRRVFAFLLLILAAMHMTATGLSCGTELPLNPKFCNE